MRTRGLPGLSAVRCSHSPAESPERPANRWHHADVRHGWAWGTLLGRSLRSPVAVSWQVWSCVVPLVALDACVVDYLTTGEFRASRTLQWVGAALVSYVIAGGWFVFGGCLIRSMGGYFRLGAAIAVYGLAGATWVALSFWLMRDPAVPLAVAVFAGMGIGLVSYTAIAVALTSRQAAQEASVAFVAAQQEVARMQTDLQAVSLAVRQRYAEWARHVLAPSVSTLLDRLAPLGSVTDLAWVRQEAVGIGQAVDDLRESVVRATSQRMHPATRVLGVRATLATVLKGHLQVHSELELHGEIDGIPEHVVGLFARALDLWLMDIVMLSPRPYVGIRATAASDADVLELTGGRWDSIEGSLVIHELRARLQINAGTIRLWETHEGLAHLVLTIPRTVPSALPSVTSPAEVSVPALSALLLCSLTASVLALMGDGLPVVVAGSIAALSVAVFAALILRAAPGALMSSPWRVTLGFVAPVALSTSAVVTAVWVVLSSTLGDRPVHPPLAFFASNALVVAVVVAGTAFFRRTVARWQVNLEGQAQAAEDIRQSCAVLVRTIDARREAVSQVMHGQVQARLIVASARVESFARGVAADRQAAEVALRLIRDVDIPRILQCIEGTEAQPTVGEMIRELTQSLGVSVTLESDESMQEAADVRVLAIIQEAVVNAVRHGTCARININVEGSPDGALIRILDDGRGAADRTNGLGLAIIDVLTDGSWSLHSTDEGTLLTATVGG
jgi:hypothetical protein